MNDYQTQVMKKWRVLLILFSGAFFFICSAPLKAYETSFSSDNTLLSQIFYLFLVNLVIDYAVYYCAYIKRGPKLLGLLIIIGPIHLLSSIDKVLKISHGDSWIELLSLTLLLFVGTYFYLVSYELYQLNVASSSVNHIDISEDQSASRVRKQWLFLFSLFYIADLVKPFSNFISTSASKSVLTNIFCKLLIIYILLFSFAYYCVYAKKGTKLLLSQLVCGSFFSLVAYIKNLKHLDSMIESFSLASLVHFFIYICFLLSSYKVLRLNLKYQNQKNTVTMVTIIALFLLCLLNFSIPCFHLGRNLINIQA